MRDRAYRRWQAEKKKKKVSTYFNNEWYVRVDDETKSPVSVCYADKLLYKKGYNQDPKRIGALTTTPTPCSCYMCGNPRKHFGALTRQEIKAQLDDKDEAA